MYVRYTEIEIDQLLQDFHTSIKIVKSGFIVKGIKVCPVRYQDRRTINKVKRLYEVRQ